MARRGAAANLDQLDFGPGPAGPFVGDCWEWTASYFDGYPGFEAFPYREYSEVFFGSDYRVLRGASWATRPSVARATFRNWDLPAAAPDLRRLPVRDEVSARSEQHRPTAASITSSRRRARRAHARRSRSCRPSTSTTRAARSCSTASPRCPSTTPTPRPSARSSTADAPEIVERGRRGAGGARVGRWRPRRAALLYAMAGAGSAAALRALRRGRPVVEQCADELASSYPGLDVHGVVGDFQRDLARIPEASGGCSPSWAGRSATSTPPSARAFLGRCAS